MTTLKQGDLIKNGMGMKCKILGVCGEVVFVSSCVNHNRLESTGPEMELKEDGYTWDTPAWKPKLYDVYVYINAKGHVSDSIWYSNESDNYRKDFLGVYQTKELAEAALLEIRRKLGK